MIEAEARTLSYIRGADVPLIEKTISQVLADTARRFPDRDALVVCHQGVRLTWAELDREVTRTARGLPGRRRPQDVPVRVHRRPFPGPDRVPVGPQRGHRPARSRTAPRHLRPGDPTRGVFGQRLRHDLQAAHAGTGCAGYPADPFQTPRTRRPGKDRTGLPDRA